MNDLDIRTLGPIGVRFDGISLDLGTRKQRGLFALLVANRRRAVSADRIVASLWGEAAEDERRRDVWVYVSRLRKGLEPAGELLRRNGAGYELDVADEAVDAIRFEARTAVGRDVRFTDPPAASRILREALGMWSGDAYGEFAREDFVAADVARLEEVRLVALEAKLDADLAWRDPGILIPEVEGLVAAHPLRSRLVAGLMVALYRNERQADALAAYRDFGARLAEMGLRPPAHLRQLEERVLVDDPQLHSITDRVMSR